MVIGIGGGSSIDTAKIVSLLLTNDVVLRDLVKGKAQLVRRGVPFRTAHGIVGELVRYCLASKKTLQSLTLQEYQQISPQFDEAVLGVVSLQEAVNNKNSRGGTAYLHVLDAIRQAKEDLGRAC